jgi:quercetin dioxygenase-like cupin family protein
MPFVDTHQLDTREPLPGWTGRYFHSENMTFAYYEFTSGASIHAHAHDTDEVWHVIEGELEVTIDGETKVAGPGMAGVVPPNVRHSVTARTDGRAIVVDHPRRSSVAGIDLG